MVWDGFLQGSSYSTLVHTLQEGSWQKEWYHTARQSPRPPGIFSTLERECLTGVFGGTAEHPPQDNLKSLTAHVFGAAWADSLGATSACWGAGTQLPDLTSPVPSLPAVDFFLFSFQGFGIQSKQLS